VDLSIKVFTLNNSIFLLTSAIMLKYIFAIQFGFLSSLLFAQQPNFSFPETKVPVTEKPINNAPELFRFAIMSDRTGAMLPGVFEEAVKKVNLLQPEFVLSVGDLIDGYTEDPNVWNDQWDEFEAIVEQLKMPFFFVPGNHDISNDKLLEVWKERRGNPWFHFVNKDVLFIGLHTEDRKGGGISNEQVAYVKKALEENKNAK
jgi:predicted phosphodiesterase